MNQFDPVLRQESQPLAALAPHLNEGEEVVWCARPGANERRRLFWTQSLIGVVGVGGVLAFLVGAVSQNLPAWKNHFATGNSGQVLGLLVCPGGFIALFLGIFLYMATMMFRATTQARRTIYAITSQRVMQVEPTRGGDSIVHDFAPYELEHFTVVRRKDGSGNLLFQNAPDEKGGSGMRSGGSRPVLPGFYGVGEVRRVESLLNEFIQRPRSATPAD
jgi:uncharacterized membrane protein YidH (DUF202 family)